MDMLDANLEAWGADIEGALQRMMDDSVFYHRLLREYAQNPALWELVVKVGDGQYKESYITAHSLKGAAANLGLIPIMERLEIVVRDLRFDPDEDELTKDMKGFMLERDRFIEIMADSY